MILSRYSIGSQNPKYGFSSTLYWTKNLVVLTIISSSLLSLSVAALATGISEEAQLEIDQCLDGNLSACHEVSMRYEFGDDVPLDFEKSASYCAKGCYSGHINSCYNLAVSYGDGEGVERDEKRATDLYDRVCKYGDQDGCERLNELR